MFTLHVNVLENTVMDRRNPNHSRCYDEFYISC